MLVSLVPTHDPDLDRNTEQLIRSRGYLPETYNVTTEDGYILKVSRIVDPHRSIYNVRKPMILGHGLFLNADSFLLNSPVVKGTGSKYGNNLGFSLMLTGRFDVWLINYRGCEYSQNHVNFSATDYRFWQFTIDQMAEYDLPAVIHFVQQKTQYKNNIGYIGYSQGSTVGFALLASKPHYANIIQPFVALAPIVYMKNAHNFYGGLKVFAPLLRYRSKKFILSKIFINNLIVGATCHWVSPLCWFGLAFRLGSTEITNMNKSRAEIYARWHGTSDLNIVHWSQLYRSDKFSKFDYGTAKLNKKHYGKTTNPEYNIGKISSSAKIIMIQSKNDELSTIDDGKRLKQELNNAGVKSVIHRIIDYPQFTHIDFVYGMNAGEQYIDSLIDTLLSMY